MGAFVFIVLTISGFKMLKSGVNNDYPYLDYTDAEILKDTKNILHQNFVEKYC